MTPTRMHAIMSGQDRSVSTTLARLGLSCASQFYRGVIAVRNAMFDRGLRNPVKLPRPVISIGNITTGGTGKTPLVMELARRLLAMGASPGILTRGYRGGANIEGAERTSDEVEIFRREFGETAPVEANASRVAGAASMLEKHAQISVFLLDDGFQHRQVHRDLDLVLIDATQPFGYGRLLPRGLLREPVKNLNRGDVFILTRCNEVEPERVEEIARQASGNKSKLIVRAEQHWREIRRADDARLAVDHMRSLPLFAFTGIGNPAAFEKMLRRHADEVRGVRAFPDHHAFSESDVRNLIVDAKTCGAKAMVTTEKDWTKVGSLIDWSASPLPLLRPVLCVDFPNADEWDGIERKIKACLAGT